MLVVLEKPDASSVRPYAAEFAEEADWREGLFVSFLLLSHKIKETHIFYS